MPTSHSSKRRVQDVINPILSGFINQGISGMVNSLSDGLFLMYEQIILQRLPSLLDTTARGMINDMLTPLFPSTACPPVTDVPPSPPHSLPYFRTLSVNTINSYLNEPERAAIGSDRSAIRSWQYSASQLSDPSVIRRYHACTCDTSNQLLVSELTNGTGIMELNLFDGAPLVDVVSTVNVSFGRALFAYLASIRSQPHSSSASSARM